MILTSCALSLNVPERASKSLSATWEPQALHTSNKAYKDMGVSLGKPVKVNRSEPSLGYPASAYV